MNLQLIFSSETNTNDNELMEEKLDTMKKIIPKKECVIYYDFEETGPKITFYDLASWESDMKTINIYGDLMSGKDFYEAVEGGMFIDYDGTLADVLINDAPSNLGLNHRGIHQGNFMVDGKTWLILCDKYDIKVHWCNK